MRFAFRIGNHFGCSDGADEDLQGYDANFGALLDERYPFRVIRLPYNILVATRPSAVFPSLDRVGSYCAGRAPELPSQRRRSSLTSAPSRRRAPRSGARARATRRTRPPKSGLAQLRCERQLPRMFGVDHIRAMKLEPDRAGTAVSGRR